MKKIHYIHFPKTGGTFFSHYANKFCKDILKGHGHHKVSYLIENNLIKEDDFIFSFIRNPFDWYISRYFYFAQHTLSEEVGISINSDSGLYGKEFIKKFPTPESHIKWGLKECKPFSFTYRYNEMFLTKEGKNRINFIGKWKDLPNKMDEAFEKGGVKPEITFSEFCLKYKDKLYANKTKRLHYRNYYNQKLIDLVHKADGVLIKEYGYEF